MTNIRFTSRTTDLQILTMVGIIAVTVLAAVTFTHWAQRARYISGSYLVPSDSDETANDIYIIRNYWPCRVVQPEWVSSKPDLYENWSKAEVKARTAVVFAGWLIVSVGLVYILLQLHHAAHGTKLANKPKAPVS